MEDEMVGWHHQLNAHEFEQAPGDSEVQGSLVCCSPWGCKESAVHIRWPKCWSFSFSPSNEYSGLIFFKIDWFALLAVQGTFKSLLQHHSLKASILHHSALFMVHFSHLYMTTGKTIALTILFLWSLLTKDP